MSEVELKELTTKLDKAIESNEESNNLLDLLNKLDTYEITTTTLRSSSLGKTVNKLRKHSDSQVASTSNKLVTKWKEIVEISKKSSQPDESSDKKRKTEDSPEQSPKKSKKEKKDKKEKKHKKEKKDKKKKKSDDDEDEQQPVVAKKIKITMSSAAANSPVNSPKSKSSSEIINDPKRKKAIEMLTDKLLAKQEEDSYEASDIASHIESELIKKYLSSNDSNYKSKLLSIQFNLGKNPELCASVMTGAITPAKLITMTPQEMASDEIKELRRKIEQNNLDACQMAKPSQIETEMFKCGKCGSRKTSYFQLQTRSADEPMTTFHNCTGCGHRWRS